MDRVQHSLVRLVFLFQAFNQGLIDILITNDGQYMEEDSPQNETEGSGSGEASASDQQARKRRREDASKVSTLHKIALICGIVLHMASPLDVLPSPLKCSRMPSWPKNAL